MASEMHSSRQLKESRKYGNDAENGVKTNSGATKSPPQFKLEASSAQGPEGAEVAIDDIHDAGFGVRINHDQKTLQIVANVYTSTGAAHLQAQQAAATWNAKTSTADGYTISFDMQVIQVERVTQEEVMATYPDKEWYNKKGKLNQSLVNKYIVGLTRMRAVDAAEADPIGKSFAGNQGMYSRVVDGESYVGGQTGNGKHADMNTHREKGDLGDNNDLVVHEFGHFFGLDDEDGNHDGTTDAYYPGDGGTMEYEGSDLHDISEADVQTILRYAKDALASTKEGEESPIRILESVGMSDGNNPIGYK
ncbi:MAG: hypothetical protein IPN95_21690 [Bacteroidetes bacterium]|nr:hypothetical protein [Bacteroidota bacterium]MBP6641388.1 hypothetical protein [Bacteroidia bacterium]